MRDRLLTALRDSIMRGEYVPDQLMDDIQAMIIDMSTKPNGEIKVVTKRQTKTKTTRAGHVDLCMATKAMEPIPMATKAMEPIPGYRLILISYDGKLRVVSVGAWIDLDAEYSGGVVFMQIDELKKAGKQEKTYGRIAKATSDDTSVSFTYANGQVLKFQASENDGRDMPMLESPKGDREDCPNLEWVSRAMDEDESRINLNGLYFERGFIVATNGRSLHRLEWAGEIFPDRNPSEKMTDHAEEGVIIRSQNIKSAIAISKRTGQPIWVSTDGFIGVGTTYQAKAMVDAQFPHYRQVIPNDVAATIPADGIFDCIMGFAIGVEEGDYALALEFAPEGITITSHDGQVTRKVDTSCLVAAKICLAATLLRPAMAGIEITTLGYTDQHHPVVLTGDGKLGDGKLAVVMPMRL